MRFIKGGNFFNLLRKEGRFDENRARFYVIQLALGLGHLHSQNILYRDLKPENILMEDDGYICIVDFGLSRILTTNNVMTRTFAGTPEYIAPEVSIDCGTDYSF